MAKNSWYDVLTHLAGKTIAHIHREEHDSFAVVHFTDGTLWIMVAERCNAASCHLVHYTGEDWHGPNWPEKKREEESHPPPPAEAQGQPDPEPTPQPVGACGDSGLGRRRETEGGKKTSRASGKGRSR